MVHILASVKIEELQKFIGVFSTAGASARRKHGSSHCQVFSVPGNPNEMRLLFEWDSREAFEGFLYDADVKETMKSSGTRGRPEFVFLDKLVELPS